MSTSPSRSRIDYVRTPISRAQGRSLVQTTGGVVASEHPAASQAGAMVLARGGHAVDAAIAANAVMGVVAPMMNGIGGDLFAIVHDAGTNGLFGLNASGWAPAALPARVQALGHRTMPASGIDSVTVPGAVSGWFALHARFGRLEMPALLEAAVHHAEAGFPVSEITALEWQAGEAFLAGDTEASRIYLPDGRAPRAGDVFRNPDLAATYERLAARGPDDFYRGDTAARMLDCAARHGGALDADDLAAYAAEWVTPLTTTYRGWTVAELPPNGQGLAVLQMLHLLETFPMARFGHNSADALHAIIEAKKLAYADMLRHVADPSFVRVPVEALLDRAYAAARARLINPVQASAHASAGALPARGGDTTYLAAVDRHGNMVSLIQSNFSNFGAGIVAPGTGFVLQCRGALFSLDPTHPNVLAPRKRPLHTIIPGFMQRGETTMAFGIMGGWNQAQAHAQFVSNVVDHDLNIQAALEAPRVTKLTFEGIDVVVESGVPGHVIDDLRARGHEVAVHASFSNMVGGGQAVMRDGGRGVNLGASDPRKDGAAIPEPAACGQTRA
jgi:gamma-glutamyltranspeptidase/glutathione hydrolase